MIRYLLSAALFALLISGCATTENIPSVKEEPMIVHSVFFNLKHTSGSAEEAEFLSKASSLGDIPGVGNFQVLKETSPKNDFDFGLSMVFSDQAAYDAYNNHADHVAFVQEVWLKEVAAFQEIDYVPYSK